MSLAQTLHGRYRGSVRSATRAESVVRFAAPVPDGKQFHYSHDRAQTDRILPQSDRTATLLPLWLACIVPMTAGGSDDNFYGRSTHITVIDLLQWPGTRIYTATARSTSSGGGLGHNCK